MKRIGIWIDLKEAKVYNPETTDFTILTSEIEDFRPVGGSRSPTVYGPEITVKEKAYLNRKKHQTNQFFKQIISHVGHVHELLIVGPAEMKTQFKKYIDNDNTFNPGLIDVQAMDSITDNQIKAYIRDWFSNNK